MHAVHGSLSVGCVLWYGFVQRFTAVQAFATDGAHAAEHFRGVEGDDWIAIANFGDRLGKRYSAQSSLWRRRRRQQPGEEKSENGLRTLQFEEVGTVQTYLLRVIISLCCATRTVGVLPYPTDIHLRLQLASYYVLHKSTREPNHSLD